MICSLSQILLQHDVGCLCGIHEGGKKSMQYISYKLRREETIWETQV
jgi:hypothetical protein